MRGVLTALCKGVSLMQLGSMSGMSLSVSNAQVLPHKVPATLRIVTTVNVLRSVYAWIRRDNGHIKSLEELTIELMSVEMLCTRVAFPAALVLTLELLVLIWFGDLPPLLRWLSGTRTSMLRSLMILNWSVRPRYVPLCLGGNICIRHGHRYRSSLHDFEGWAALWVNITGYTASLSETSALERLDIRTRE